MSFLTKTLAKEVLSKYNCVVRLIGKIVWTWVQVPLAP